MGNLFPIEQLVTCDGYWSQIAFGRKACDLLPESIETLFMPSNRGLLMLGKSEGDFTKPYQFLREVFGSCVHFSMPRVRLVYAGGWQQPIMGFRIEANSSQIRQVERSLELRAARFSDMEIHERMSIIRGEAPLEGLIGYHRSLQRLAGATAHAILWLSHYEPLRSYPSETMACYAG